MASRSNARKCRACGKRKPGNAFAVGGGTQCRACSLAAHDARKRREALSAARAKKRTDEFIARVRKEMGLP